MRVLLLALPGTDHSTLRASLGAALGASSVDVCQAVEAAVTWLENRPCDLVAVAGPAAGVRDGLARLRRASRSLPVLALLPETTSPEAGAAWLAGADDVLTLGSLAGATAPEGLDDVRTADRDTARRIQKLWYAGPSDGLRQQLLTRLTTRFRDVGLSGEGLSGLTTQDFEAPQSAALVVNALAQPEAMVLGVRRVKRTYQALAITVVADVVHHDAFRRAGADECVAGPGEVEQVLLTVSRAQGRCRTTLELDALRARETRLRALVEQLPEAVVLVSPEHAVLAVNVAGLRLIGAHDARQVLGAPLAPWIASESEDGLTTLVDTVVGGATREAVATTSQLATPRRLLIRAVPFQRESGGRPAALMVLRDLASDPLAQSGSALDGMPDASASQTLEAERTRLAERVSTLEAELATAVALAERIPVLEEALNAAISREQVLAPALQTAAKLEGFGVDVDRIPELLDAAQHLLRLEQQELPAMRLRLQELESLETEVVPALRAELAQAQKSAVATEQLEALHQAAQRLYEVEQEEVPALRAAAAEQAALHDMAASTLMSMRDRVTALEAQLADARQQAEASASAPEARVQELERAAAAHVAEREALDAALTRVRELEAQLAAASGYETTAQAGAERLAELEREQHAERAALDATLDRVRNLEAQLATAMAHDESGAAASRIAELEDQVADAAVQRMALMADATRAQELERQLAELVHANLALEADIARLSARAGQTAPAQVATSVAPEQEWMLEEVAALGVVHTTCDGQVLAANDHAARTCGFGCADELVRAGHLPEPLRLLAGDDLTAPSRFEVCLQAEGDTLPRWVAGVRLPQRDDEQVTWWLADVSNRQPTAAREQVRVEAMSSVLEVATAECASLVTTPAARVLGPRRLERIADDEDQADAEAVTRAQVMLGQLTALGRRRSMARAEDLRARLGSLAPLLERLGGDDVAWSLALPESPVHACISAVEFERCVTALVTSGRDALPLGGRLSLHLRDDDGSASTSGIRRPESLLTLAVQGYGRTDVRVPAAVSDLVAGMGARLEVVELDAMGAEIRMRVPRAFLLTDAA